MKGKEYVRPIPSNWWLQRPGWTKFMIREATALFVAGYAVFLLVLVHRAQNAESFSAFFQGLKSPVSLILHVITLAMVLYHAFTWFGSLPQAVAVWRGEERVSASLLVSSQYVALLIVSALVAWIAIGLS
jgi:fumarate reductase subunit C